VAESLAALERWMQALLTHPGGVAAGVASPAARAERVGTVEDVFLPSHELSAAERVGVYADMYFARLIEVLEEEFPGLVAWLGHERAHALFHAYVVSHPSRFYSLNRLGAELEMFVRDEAEFADDETELRAVAIELARLERSIQDVFDAPEHATLTPETLAAVPPELWPGARLVFVPAFALHVFEHPINAWYRAFRDDEPLPELRVAPSHVAVFRQSGGRVWRMDLDPAQHALLAALATGLALEPALQSLDDAGHDLAAIAPDLQSWFSTWAREGFFAEVADGRR
jgi:hypothetical protein